MKKIYFYLILLYSISFYGNDTITVLTLKNIKLKEQATIDSKILSEIKTNDTLKLTSIENNWAKVIYKDSLNGYVKNEFLKVVKNEQVEILKLNILKKLFFKAFFLISILCFCILYLLKKKLIQLEINGNLSLIAKSLLIGFLLAIIGTLYIFFDQLSFFKIFSILILLLFLYYRISSIFKIENRIKEDKLFFNNGSVSNLSLINKNFISNQILTEDELVKKAENNLLEVKEDGLKLLDDQLNNIAEITSNHYGPDNAHKIIYEGEPFIGLHKVYLDYCMKEPDKINKTIDDNNKAETYFYEKINNRGNDGIFKLKINIHNDIVTSIQTR